jgi:hypothetical protein
MREARRPAARTPAHEALLRFPVEILRADVARLALGVLRALLDRDYYSLRVLVIGMILLGAAAFLNLFAELVMAAFFPVLLLAGRPAVARLAAAALLGQVWQRGSATGALREDHRAPFWERPNLVNNTANVLAAQ